MTSTIRLWIRPLGASCAALIALSLTGCQEKKVIARINEDAITSPQYESRLERVGQSDFQQFQVLANGRTDVPLEAGAIGLVNMLRERAIDALAKQQHATPSQTDVDQMFAFLLVRNPNLAAALKKGLVSEADEKHVLFQSMEQLAIGTEGAKVDEKELNDEFNKEKPQLDVPEEVGMKLLQVKDQTDGQLVLNRLQATGDFKTEAQKEAQGLPTPLPRTLSGEEVIAPIDSIQKQAKSLYDAIHSLTPGKFAPAPIDLSAGAPTQPGQQRPPAWVVVQLTQKLQAHPATLNETRVLITQSVLEHKFPEWKQHFDQVLSDYLIKAKIDINIDRYKPVAGFLQSPPPKPAMNPSFPMGMQGQPGPGQPRMSTAPRMAQPGRMTAPPSTGGKPTAPNGAH